MKAEMEGEEMAKSGGEESIKVFYGNEEVYVRD